MTVYEIFTLTLDILYFAPIYFISLIYCIWRFKKGSEKFSLDGVIGVSPGLETIAVLAFPTVLAIGDLVVTGVNKLFKTK